MHVVISFFESGKKKGIHCARRWLCLYRKKDGWRPAYDRCVWSVVCSSHTPNLAGLALLWIATFVNNIDMKLIMYYFSHSKSIHMHCSVSDCVLVGFMDPLQVVWPFVSDWKIHAHCFYLIVFLDPLQAARSCNWWKDHDLSISCRHDVYVAFPTTGLKDLVSGQNNFTIACFVW